MTDATTPSGQTAKKTAAKRAKAKASTAPNAAARTAETGTDAVAAGQAGDLVASAKDAVLAGMVTGDGSALAYETVTASSADITDEVEKGGPAFGAFVKAVGLAIAESQAALDANLVKTAEMLSKQTIDVIAIYEQQIGDDGMMEQGKPIIQKLPLINYLMPTAYQWSRVHLESDMKVTEFNTANGFNIKRSGTSFGASAGGGYGLLQGGWHASGRMSVGHSSTSQSGEVSSSVDSASGTLHMEATLEPRGDVQLPQPFIVQKGPRLKVTSNSKTDIMSSTTEPQVIGRKEVFDVVLTKKDGSTPNSGQALDVRVDQPLLDVIVSGSTDNNGKATISVERKGGAWDETTRMTAVMRVSFGLVTETVAITL